MKRCPDACLVQLKGRKRTCAGHSMADRAVRSGLCVERTGFPYTSTVGCALVDSGSEQDFSGKQMYLQERLGHDRGNDGLCDVSIWVRNSESILYKKRTNFILQGNEPSRIHFNIVKRSEPTRVAVLYRYKVSARGADHASEAACSPVA